MEGRYIYLDNGASTKIDEEALNEMIKYYKEFYGVATSQFGHSMGIKSKEALDNSRDFIARRLNASFEEIIFTSGGTESNNFAIKGVAKVGDKRKKILVSSIEHFSVLHTARTLEKEGFEILKIPVDKKGFVDIDYIRDNIENALLISVQHSNYEVGTIQPIEEIGKIAKEKGVIFHTDAAYSFGWLEIDVSKLNVDLLTFTGHKIHGPKGIGGLYIRKGTNIKKWMDGGFNEFDLRGGTENVPGVVGMSKALEKMTKEEIEKVKNLIDYLKEKLLSIKDSHLNGDEVKRHPANINITFDYIEGESVVLHLDMRGIAVITGSACFSRALEPSHVLMAMGYSHEQAHGSIRFSLGRFNKKEEMDYVYEQTKEVVEKLRSFSPLKGG